MSDNLNLDEIMMLKPYQREALESIFKNKDLFQRQLIVLPTGTGKTIVFLYLLYFANYYFKKDFKALILVNKDVLVNQTFKQAHRILGRKFCNRISIEKAEHKAKMDSKLIIASKQTLEKKKRLEKYTPTFFDIIICDEAHHSIATGYTKIFEYFGFKKLNKRQEDETEKEKNRLLLGFTATPKRADNVGLANIFEYITYQKDLAFMIDNNYLPDIVAYRVDTNVDISNVKISKGDFAVNELSKILNIAKRNYNAVAFYKDHFLKDNKQAIIFCVDIKHAKDVCEIFQENNISCEVVHSKMKKSDREDIIKRYRKGEIKVLTNCMVFTEGFDVPAVSVIMLLRPTKSSSLYAQMIGRGCRKEKHKKTFYVVDFVDMSQKHSLVTAPTLFGLSNDYNCSGKRLSREKKKIEDKIKMSKIPINVENIKEYETYDFEKISIINVERPKEIKKFTKLLWFKSNSNKYRLNILNNYYAEIKIDMLDQCDVFITSRDGVPIEKHFKTRKEAFEFCDNTINNMFKEGRKLFTANQSWHNKPATEKQINFLKKLKIYDDKFSYTKLQANRIIELSLAKRKKQRS